jgi:epsilon-lactone hydrolase
MLRCGRSALLTSKRLQLLFASGKQSISSGGVYMPDQDLIELRKMIVANPLPTDLEALRLAVDADSERFPLDPDIKTERVSVAVGLPAEWTWTPAADPARVVLYLHGGGYLFGSILSHRHLVAEIGRACGSRTLTIDYRLSPENPFPAAVDDGLASYGFLLEEGFEPRHIALAGDSAGGGLVVSTLVAIREAGLPQPACGWLISPWVDMEASGETFVSRADADPMVKREIIVNFAQAYLNGADPRSPLASPIYADLRGIAPLLIHVGASEVLLDDSLKLARAAGAADVSVRLEIWPEMVHIWHVFHRILGDGRKAVQEGAKFLREAMDGRANHRS